MYVCPTCQHPTLPPAVEPSSYRLCRRCGLHFAPDLAQHVTDDRAPQGETVRLFEPAPAQMPGQLGWPDDAAPVDHVDNDGYAIHDA